MQSSGDVNAHRLEVHEKDEEYRKATSKRSWGVERVAENRINSIRWPVDGRAGVHWLRIHPFGRFLLN